LHDGRQVIAAVKAGAYDHGLETVARTLARGEIAFFGVANVYKARRLAEARVFWLIL